MERRIEQLSTVNERLRGKLREVRESQEEQDLATSSRAMQSQQQQQGQWIPANMAYGSMQIPPAYLTQGPHAGTMMHFNCPSTGEEYPNLQTPQSQGGYPNLTNQMTNNNTGQASGNEAAMNAPSTSNAGTSKVPDPQTTKSQNSKK